MAIHRRVLHNVPTRPGKVAGFLWQQAPRRKVRYEFKADLPVHNNSIQPPYIDVEWSFALPVPVAEVCDTLIKISGHTLLVTSYFDARLEPNPNLGRDFPLIPWRGEIAVLFIGKRRHFLARGPPESIVQKALAIYMGICLTDAQRGMAFPAYMKISDGPVEYVYRDPSEEI
ncbi:hypothetical protein BGY98DRAFT_1180293 [Russula aff. rugulosa BPL654]|nr:hypothetical protein BGY98DRAFT_1180293 [Russula aff. rugulosa BPL654]